jgi:hypothetical protein
LQTLEVTAACHSNSCNRCKCPMIAPIGGGLQRAPIARAPTASTHRVTGEYTRDAGPPRFDNSVDCNRDRFPYISMETMD